jgi:hypothetical protein
MTTPFKSDYAFGLMVHEIKGRRVIEHGGGIEGFNTQLTYHPEDKVTVVVLGNVNGTAPEEIATKLAAIAHGEQVKAPADHKAIALTNETLAKYVGTYAFAPGMNLLVMLEGEQLKTKLGSQPAFEIYPESETQFFLKVVDAQLEFVKDAKGQVTDVILHQNGRDQKAPRKSTNVELPQERKSIAVAAAVLKQYTGVYELAPGVDVAMTIEGDQLMTQITGQPKFPLYAETESRFFLKVADAQVDFVRGPSGAVTQIVLHQGGVDHTAKRR